MEQKESAEKLLASTAINLHAADGWLQVQERGGEYQARFDGVSIRALIDLVGQALLREERYANQLRIPFTVLQHTWMLTAFLTKRKMPTHIIAYAAVHDTAEAFVRDVPSPLKSPQAKAIEDAIYRAMPWANFQINAYSAGFKEFDGWVSAVEAQALGPWNNTLVSSRLPPEPEMLSEMKDALQMTLATPSEFILENWKGFITNNCLDPEVVGRCGLDRPFILK